RNNSTDWPIFALNIPISNLPSLSQWNVWVPRDVSAMTNSCVVIYFTFMYPATPRHPRYLVLWQTLLPALPVCGVQDIVRESYKGRTKLIGDVHQRNCTLLISNIGTEHSGRYNFCADLVMSNTESTSILLHFVCNIFHDVASIEIFAIPLLPSVLTPPLTEGEPVTLTCTAPGIDNITELRDNTTTQRRVDLTAFTTTHFSTLTFTPSAKHDGTKVTCLVTFNGSVTTKKTLKLNVTRKYCTLSDLVLQQKLSGQSEREAASHPKRIRRKTRM
uniref:Ig-like domain-containing protein n=1 Tax=Oncorhynchus kisutch TaxID=8019 RepID=A0A8C7G9U7_ONCKI